MSNNLEGNYLLVVSFWTRSWDGDDWVDGEHSWRFSSLQEAMIKADNPFIDNKNLISSEVYSIIDNKKELMFRKDWV
jgi:hypothetical protein